MIDAISTDHTDHLEITEGHNADHDSDDIGPDHRREDEAQRAACTSRVASGVVSGEPGIGKSRLAQTLIERLAGEPHTRLRFFCSPHHQDQALYPTITQLERAAGFRREDTADQRLDKLEAVLAQATNDLGEAAPLLLRRCCRFRLQSATRRSILPRRSRKR